MKASSSSASTAPRSVCIVTVTYGDRSHLLSRVIQSVLQRNELGSIDSVVVVNNGASGATEVFLRELQASDARVRVVNLESNQGSAIGFSRGLEAARQSSARYVWVLDDDNEPREGALSELIRQAEASSAGRMAFVSLREDRSQYMKYAAGESAATCFGAPNSFLGFSIRKVFQRAGRCIGVLVPRESNPSSVRLLPYGPYGGLFFETRMIDEIGLPSADFVLYNDDHEYTLRFSKAGVSLMLVPGSRLVDIEQSWTSARGGQRTHFVTPWVQLSNNPDISRRVYYSSRNRVFLERNGLDHAGIIYHLNAFLFISAVLSLAFVASVWTRSGDPLRGIQPLSAGIRDGFAGRLGSRPERWR